MEWWIYLIFIIAAALAAGVAALFIRRAVLNKKGEYLAKQVTSKLKSYSSLRQYKVLTNLRLPYRGGEKVISHVLVGIFGVIVADAYSLRGELYGTADDKKWAYVHKGGKKEQLPNLAIELQEKVDAVRQCFAAQGIYKVTIDSVNVVQNSEKKLMLYVASSLPVIRLKRLGAFLGKTKYDTDAGVDMDKLAGILKASSQAK